MTREEKISAITELIELGRVADDIINTCAKTIGEILDNKELGELSKDFIFVLPGDMKAKDRAHQLVTEANQ